MVNLIITNNANGKIVKDMVRVKIELDKYIPDYRVLVEIVEMFLDSRFRFKRLKDIPGKILRSYKLNNYMVSFLNSEDSEKITIYDDLLSKHIPIIESGWLKPKHPIVYMEDGVCKWLQYYTIIIERERMIGAVFGEPMINRLREENVEEFLKELVSSHPIFEYDRVLERFKEKYIKIHIRECYHSLIR